MAGGARGRGKERVDVEALERDNEHGLDSLAEKVGLLKMATQGIKGEVDNQHVTLDGMDDGMMGTRGILTSVNDKFKTVMSNKSNRQMTILVVVALSILVVFWWLSKRK